MIGVPQIDNQHRKLIEAIDKLMEACKQGKGRVEIEKTLVFTLQYTIKHFNDEEKLQEKHKYPGLSEHKQIHKRFTEDIAALAQEFNKLGPSIALTVKLNQSLVDWVINHISTEDKKVGEHIRKVAGIF